MDIRESAGKEVRLEASVRRFPPTYLQAPRRTLSGGQEDEGPADHNHWVYHIVEKESGDEVHTLDGRWYTTWSKPTTISRTQLENHPPMSVYTNRVRECVFTKIWWNARAFSVLHSVIYAHVGLSTVLT